MAIESGMCEQESGSLFEQVLRLAALLWKRATAQRIPNHPGRLIDGHRPIRQRAKKLGDTLDQLATRLAKFTGCHFDRCDAIAQCISCVHGSYSPWVVNSRRWLSQAREEIILYLATAIDQTEGAIIGLALPELLLVVL